MASIVKRLIMGEPQVIAFGKNGIPVASDSVLTLGVGIGPAGVDTSPTLTAAIAAPQPTVNAIVMNIS
jgi:hypothetical protein